MTKIKLKTLKDIEETTTTREAKFCLGNNAISVITKDRIKEEAIKHIKELRTYGYPDCEDGCCYKGDGSPYIARVEGDSYYIDNVENWIMNFFDIQESDLK